MNNWFVVREITAISGAPSTAAFNCAIAAPLGTPGIDRTVNADVQLKLPLVLAIWRLFVSAPSYAMTRSGFPSPSIAPALTSRGVPEFPTMDDWNVRVN